MIDWLSTWWPLLLIYVSGTVLSSWVGLFYQWIDRRLDELVPDDRKRTTEEWVGAKLDELGLVAEVDLGRWGPVAMRSSNAFLPWNSSIALADVTADKRDATFWIVGAHELGHAMWHRRLPRISRLALGARGAAIFPWHFFLTLMLVNTLWGWDVVSSMMFFLLICCVGLMALVLLDEAAASLTAFQLVQGEKFSALERRAMRIKLLAAFSTYLAAVVPAAILLVCWRPLRSFLEAGQEWVRPMDPNHEWWVGVLVAVALASIATLGGFWVRQKLRSDHDDDDDEDEPELSWRDIVIAVVVMVLLAVWSAAFWFMTFDRPYGDAFRVALIFAAPLGWLLPGLAIEVAGVLLNRPVNWIRKALDLVPKVDPQAYLDASEAHNAEVREHLDDIDLTLDGQAKLEEEEARRNRKKKRDPNKAYEHRTQRKRKRKRGRFDLDEMPDRGSLRFWLLQLNPIWLLPAIGLWLAV